jgi:hypothetical protein
LIRSGQLTALRVAAYHRLARSFANRDAPHTAFIGTFTNPYAENQVLSLADSVTSVRPVVRFAMSAEEIEYLRNGREHLAVIVTLPPGREPAVVAAAYRGSGYAVYSIQFSGDTGRRDSSHRDLRLSELHRH